ncbi:uncharacterized protein ZHAS_00014888 [Anopheles sinensis]|uniref:Uncharacterized protein n=1 Tax=Anopheles sinensis TaxID=74873 RepID=A0A084W9H2_ANOSI|nr:uncharacterized protein ZHAS_00014888 [Anopheles sinensis]
MANRGVVFEAISHPPRAGLTFSEPILSIRAVYLVAHNRVRIDGHYIGRHDVDGIGHGAGEGEDAVTTGKPTAISRQSAAASGRLDDFNEANNSRSAQDSRKQGAS